MTKILIVDDEKDILNLLVEDLSSNGFDVVLAENGRAALGRIYRERPDVVLMDIMMPLVDGYEVLRTLRRDPTTKNLPVILLTAVSPTEGERLAVELGANHFVTKPWDSATLQAVIRVAVREAASAGGAYAAASGFIKTGNRLLDTKLGGGVPVSGLTLIEGRTSTGKSVLCQQFAHAALSNGFDVEYFTTQYSPKTLVSQMDSLGLDSSAHVRSGAFQIHGLSELDSSVKASHTLLALLQRIQESPQNTRFVIVDAITSLVNLEDDKEVQFFFTKCKTLSYKGKSIFLSVDPVGLTSDTLYRVRAISDGYLGLRIEKEGARLRNVLEVCKVRDAEELTGNIVAFEVEPGLGIKLDATRRAKIQAGPVFRVSQQDYDGYGTNIS